MACSNSKKIFFCFFNNQEKSQTPWKSFGFCWFWWFFPSKALSTRLYNSVLIIWIGSIFASSNTEKFFLRQSLRPKKSHFWRKLTKSSDFWAFFPLTFRIITRLSSKSYSMIALFFQTLIFPRKLHTLTIGKIRINWFSPSSTFGDNSRNPWIFWSFFPLTFRIIARFFSYLFFHRKTSYFNDWQNQNKLTLHQFHVWGKITKSFDFLGVFFPKFSE